MKLLTKRQAAKILKRTVGAVDKLIYRGFLPMELTTRGVRIPEEAVLNFKPVKRGSPAFGKQFGNGRGWKQSDDERLRRLYGSMPCELVAEKIGKSIASVYNRARRLGLQSKRAGRNRDNPAN